MSLLNNSDENLMAFMNFDVEVFCQTTEKPILMGGIAVTISSGTVIIR